MTLVSKGAHSWTRFRTGSAVIILRLDAGRAHKTQRLEGEEQSGHNVETHMVEPLMDAP